MRQFALAALVASFAVPAHADAHPAPVKHHHKGKHHKGKHHKGKGDKDKDKGKGKGKGKGEIIGQISGAGQRLHFSFGGQLEVRDNGRGRGELVLTAHPPAPGGNTLNVTCRLTRFYNVTINGTVTELDARGRCQVLSTSGEVSRVSTQNHITIVDNGQSGDTIDVDLVGTTGISIPSGALTFGDFDVATNA